MNSLKEKISLTEKLVLEFEKNGDKNATSPFIQAIQKKAIDSFSLLGIPNKKNEEYKYANVQAVFERNCRLQIADYRLNISIEKYLIPDLNANIIVLVNGVFFDEYSTVKNLPKGIMISSINKAFENNSEIIKNHFSKIADINSDAFIALNTAFINDGVFLFVPENTIVEKPIHTINIFTTSNSVISPRNLFIIGNNSQAQIIETTIVTDETNNFISIPVTEIFVNENAKLQYYKFQNAKNNSEINTTQVHQKANSHFDTNTATIDSSWVRNNLNIFLDGENCETHLNGLFITKENEFVDNHTFVDHQKPHCQSNQLYKGILNGKSTGVFNGKIFVKPDAQKTNAYQSSKNILLTDEATINTKPQLEIYADDVKCSHGSTTGQLNEEALFYLRSRGLSEESSKTLLLSAFANNVLDTIKCEALKNHLEKLVQNHLNN